MSTYCHITDFWERLLQIFGFNQYFPNAIITVEFHEKSKIVIYLNKEIAFATIWDSDNNIITNRKQTGTINIGELGILPQIGLIKENEKQLTDKTITKDLDTYLSSRHFRNEMLLFKEEYFEDFTILDMMNLFPYL